MGCCGQKRAALRTAVPARQPAPPAPAPRRPWRVDNGDGVTLTYVGSGGLVFRGPKSGRTYHVAAAGDLVFAHPDDVEGLLRMLVFRR